MNRRQFHAAASVSVLSVLSSMLGCTTKSRGRQRAVGADGRPILHRDTSGVTVLEPHTVRDEAAQQDAFSVLAPANWKVEGDVSYSRPPALSLRIQFRAADRDGALGVETVVSEMRNSWYENPLGRPPEGKADQGGFVIEQPKDAIAYFKGRVLPRLRREHSDYRILEIRREPKLIAALDRLTSLSKNMARRHGGDIRFDAASVKAEFTVKNERIEETAYVCTQYMPQQLGFMRSTSWGLLSLERTFAPEGDLEQELPLLKSIAHSTRRKRAWHVAVQAHRFRVWGIWRDAQADWDDYIRQQEVNSRRRDEIYRGFAHYLRGTDVKQNPFTREIRELPDAHRHVWFGEDGRILFTDRDGYDPNTDRDVGGAWREAWQ